MKKTAIVFAAAILSASWVFAAEPNNVSIYEVTGQGKSRDEAIKNGLVDAVSQARGTKVGSGSYTYGYAGAMADVNNVANHKKIDFDAISIQASGTSYTAQTGGLVKKYDVLEETKNDTGVAVKLKVWVYGLSESEKSKRMKIAVMPIKAMLVLYQFGDFQTPGENLGVMLAHQLNVGLTQTNKFAVLDRDNVIDFAREAKMLLVFDAPIAEQAKLAETMGADYFLSSTITDASVIKTERGIAATGQTVVEHEGRFGLNYSLVRSTTKEVVYAGVADVYMTGPQFRPGMIESNASLWKGEDLRNLLVGKVAEIVVGKVAEKLYPIKIAAIQDGKVILDQGQSRLYEGMVLEVLAGGDEVIDPDTKEPLGVAEQVLCTLQVVSARDKMTFANLVDGDIAKLAMGQICRIKCAGMKQEQGSTGYIKRTSNGSVKLPFDK